MYMCDLTEARSLARTFIHTFACILLTVNYRLFTHSDVSYRFNGENDNLMLESSICLQRKSLLAL